jgi:hypothetical protein
MAANGEIGFGPGVIKRMQRLVALFGLALPLLLAACGGTGQQGSVDLAVACETSTCSCTKDGGYAPKSPPVLWKSDGTAYCPESYSLYMAPPPSQRWTVGPGLQ